MPDKVSPCTLRIAIYARFSSRLQKPTSIADQVRLCRRHAEQLRGNVVTVHEDRATTAATRQFRPALRELLVDAETGQIDLILTESLDRISRDQCCFAHYLTAGWSDYFARLARLFPGLFGRCREWKGVSGGRSLSPVSS